MNKKKLLSEYKKIIKLLTSYNKNYYVVSKPLVSDKEYDDLKNRIILFFDIFYYIFFVFSIKYTE